MNHHANAKGPGDQTGAPDGRNAGDTEEVRNTPSGYPLRSTAQRDERGAVTATVIKFTPAKGRNGATVTVRCPNPLCQVGAHTHGVGRAGSNHRGMLIAAGSLCYPDSPEGGGTGYVLTDPLGLVPTYEAGDTK